MRARLETLEQALDRGEGLTPAVRALKAAGAKLVVAGVEAEPGYERAVAAGLGWRAGAVVAERLSDALAVLAEAGGEVAVILADTRPPAASLPPAAGARPLIEVVTVRDPIAGRLLEGVWLVDDLADGRSRRRGDARRARASTPTAASCGEPATPARRPGWRRGPSATGWRPRTPRPARRARCAAAAADAAAAAADRAEPGRRRRAGGASGAARAGGRRRRGGQDSRRPARSHG